MNLSFSINTWVAADIGGIDTTTLKPIRAIQVFFRVSKASSYSTGLPVSQPEYIGLYGFQCLWIEVLPLGICLASIKISVLLFYRRIFAIRAFKRWVDLMILVLIGWAISTVTVSRQSIPDSLHIGSLLICCGSRLFVWSRTLSREHGMEDD